MKEQEPPMILDFDNPDTKQRFMQKTSALTGLHTVKISPCKRRRSNDQNAYYWSAFVTPFCEWLRGAYGDDSIKVAEAHEYLKRRVLKPREGVNPNTGEVMKLAHTTTELNTKEFSDYLDRAAFFLADFADITVLPADRYFQSEAAAA